MVDAEMTYPEWLKSFDDSQMSEYTLRRKMTLNRSRDIRQYERYREVLGEDAPKTLEAFQEIKYTYAERWEDLKYYAKYKGDRPLYCVQIDRELEQQGIHIGKALPPERIRIENYSPHALKRMLEKGFGTEDAQSYIDSAKISFFESNRMRLKYLSESGVTLMSMDDHTMITGYPKSDFF